MTQPPVPALLTPAGLRLAWGDAYDITGNEPDLTARARFGSHITITAATCADLATLMWLRYPHARPGGGCST